MSDIKLGQIIEGEAHRDAIHIAIAPVVAATKLHPGDHVGPLPDGRFGSGAKDYIGIVDPFLKSPVRSDEKFYLLLYQNTITGMRHEWQHPAFKEQATLKVDGSKEDSERWLRDYAITACPYDEEPESAFKVFMRSIESNRCIFYHGRDLHGAEDLEQPEELFKHLSIYLGRPVDRESFGYTCSC